MYKQKLTNQDIERIQGGDIKLLLEKLKSSDRKIIDELKTPNSNTPFLQGASGIVDRLIQILEVNPT